jgi:hypothetical protein
MRRDSGSEVVSLFQEEGEGQASRFGLGVGWFGQGGDGHREEAFRHLLDRLSRAGVMRAETSTTAITARIEIRPIEYLRFQRIERSSAWPERERLSSALGPADGEQGNSRQTRTNGARRPKSCEGQPFWRRSRRTGRPRWP